MYLANSACDIVA